MPSQKKKTHAEARQSHLALQARRDALQRIRQGEVVTIHLAQDVGGKVVKARALRETEDPAYCMVLAIINKRLRADWCSDKDGLRVGPRRLSHGDILGLVLEVDGVSPYQGNAFFDTLRANVEKPCTA